MGYGFGIWRDCDVGDFRGFGFFSGLFVKLRGFWVVKGVGVEVGGRRWSSHIETSIVKIRAHHRMSQQETIKRRNRRV